MMKAKPDQGIVPERFWAFVHTQTWACVFEERDDSMKGKKRKKKKEKEIDVQSLQEEG